MMTMMNSNSSSSSSSTMKERMMVMKEKEKEKKGLRCYSERKRLLKGKKGSGEISSLSLKRMSVVVDGAVVVETVKGRC